MTRGEMQARWSALPGNVRGAVWTLVSGLGLSGMAVCMKVLGQRLPVSELVVLRALVGMIALSPLVLRAGIGSLRTRKPMLHFMRSAFGLGGITCFVLALVHLDLALATTLSFTRVLFVIVAAALFLGEVVRWRRASATVVGFLGVLVIAQPGGDAFSGWVLVGLFGTLFQVGVTTTLKQLTDTDTPLSITVRAYLWMGGLAAVHAVFVWRTPTLEELILVLVMGASSALGQTCMAMALRAGEATAVIPFEYARLLYAGIAGYVLFAEIPATSTWLGAAIIAASTAYIALREARRRNPPAGD